MIKSGQEVERDITTMAPRQVARYTGRCTVTWNARLGPPSVGDAVQVRHAMSNWVQDPPTKWKTALFPSIPALIYNPSYHALSLKSLEYSLSTSGPAVSHCPQLLTRVAVPRVAYYTSNALFLKLSFLPSTSILCAG
jgi:hypothetical protein